MLTLVAGALIVVACTNNLANPAPAPTAPPDAFASTPTIAGIPTTTLTPPTTIPDERVVLQRVDPVSLQPLTAFDPIPVGDWMWGSKVSDDGRFLATTVGDDAGDTELRLFDLRSWQPVTKWSESADWIVHINEFGTVYYITYQSTPELRLATVDGNESTLVASLPLHYSVWGADAVSDEMILVYGTKPAEPGSGHPDQAFVSTIGLDETGGVITEIPVPGVQIGSVDPVSQGPWASYLYTSPSFTWDPVGRRLLIVHADEAVVTEVGIDSGQVVEHELTPPMEPLSAGARRWSALRSDGRSLYVATSAVALIEDDADWMVRSTPSGVMSIDTATWQVTASSDEAVSVAWVSPNGEGLIAAGFTTDESESVYVYESTGLYLLDAADLSVRVHYPPEHDDQSWGPVTFSEAGSIAYVSTWLNTPRVHALELASGEMLSTTESTETLEMIGPVGVLASNR
jgi:hypothetical protein